MGIGIVERIATIGIVERIATIFKPKKFPRILLEAYDEDESIEERAYRIAFTDAIRQEERHELRA